jgi:isocitrate/isopropylmalate dehydrogenase
MTTHRIAILPGDGVGVEVTAETRPILESLESFVARVEFEFPYLSDGIRSLSSAMMLDYL